MPVTLRGSARSLVETHDVVLLDLDGVVYLGTQAVPGAAESLANARTRGMRLAFVTNNAARPPEQVAKHLSELGIAAEPAEVVTSAQAAARYLADQLPAGARVLVVGTVGLQRALRERGLRPVSEADPEVAAVVQGYSPDMNWPLLAEGAVAINRGVPWVATNLDPTVPSPRGPLPGNGSLVAALRHATGRTPAVTGKPDPAMHRETLLRTGARSPVVVGDRLDTDIEGANAAGCDSLLVFTGVTKPADLFTIGPELRPTYLGADLGALLTTHPQPVVRGDRAACGRWEVERRSGPARRQESPGERGLLLRLARVNPDPTPPGSAADPGHAAGFDEDELDALRALCAAAWSGTEPAANEPIAGRVMIEAGPVGDGEPDRDAAAVLARLGLSPAAGTVRGAGDSREAP